MKNETTAHHWIVHFIWSIADELLRDVYVRGRYRDVILPMTVLRPAGQPKATQLDRRRQGRRSDPCHGVGADTRHDQGCTIS
jgi:hypothetical protein